MFSAQLSASNPTYKHNCDQPREAFSVWNVRSWVGINATIRREGSTIWTGPIFAGLAVQRNYDEIIFTVKSPPTAGHVYFVDFSDTGIVPPPIDTTEQLILNVNDAADSFTKNFKADYVTELDLTGALQPRTNQQHLWLIPTRIEMNAREEADQAKTDRVDSTIPYTNNATGSGTTEKLGTYMTIEQTNVLNSIDGDPWNATLGIQSYVQRTQADKYIGGSWMQAATPRHWREVQFSHSCYFLKFSLNHQDARVGETIFLYRNEAYIFGRLMRDIPWRRP